jgi:hypothetical protein
MTDIFDELDGAPQPALTPEHARAFVEKMRGHMCPWCQHKENLGIVDAIDAVGFAFVSCERCMKRAIGTMMASIIHTGNTNPEAELLVYKPSKVVKPELTVVQ